ncbi:ATP-binding protein [Aquisalimonas sp.]|uniref:ATP-binding protein n=1 Tax=Aquisalimonas sp. TaxID=1872621 RepID=UPI0025BB9C78|nr:ATP-binding protein [Aquisalimonas sp.]
MHHQNTGFEQCAGGHATALDDILVTAELAKRPQREPNFEAENRALVALAGQWASEPETILHALVEAAIELCGAGTAGISLLEQSADGDELFRWAALAGVHEAHVFGTTPRRFSPCGTCIDRDAPQLYAHPARYFTYFEPLDPPIIEGLVIPFYADGQAAGTIWIVSHDTQRQFDLEDVRIMTSLAQFTAASWQVSSARRAAETNARRARQAEHALRINEQRCRIALTHSPLMVFNQDTDLRYTWIYNSIWEFPPNKALGQQDKEVLEHWDDIQVLDSIKRKVLETGVGSRREVRIHHSGSDHFYDLTIEPLRDDGERIVGITAAAFDITARVRAEEQAQQHLVKLAHMARLNLATEMASGLAHELNQPLAAIINYSDACLVSLRSGKIDPDVLIKTLEEVTSLGLRAGEIIHHLRKLVRKEEIHHCAVAINALIEEVVRLGEIEARQHRVQVQLNLAPALPTVYVANIQIQQVVLNLMRNSIEAMSDTMGGARELTIQTVAAEDNAVEVMVSDTGPGLSADALDRVFYPYFTTKSSGMGLGLSISKSIIEAHGGRLWATTNPDQGATFHFTLPASQSQ